MNLNKEQNAVYEDLIQDHPDVASQYLWRHATRIAVERYWTSKGWRLTTGNKHGVDEVDAFSASSCDLCLDRDAGERHAVHSFAIRTDETEDHAVCRDCLLWVANGDTPEALL